MEKIDARKQSREELLARRQQVIRLYEEKVPVMKIVEASGLSWPAVNAAIKHYTAGGESALKPAQRGRKLGTGRSLTEEQENELRNIFYTKRPWQLGIRGSSRKLFLWNRDAVMQLIEQKCGVRLSVRCVAKYLERWGFSSMKRHQQPKELCSKHVKKWLDENYEKIGERAKIENAGIYWINKKSVDTIKKPTSENNSRSPKLSLIYVISNKGKEHWMFIKGKYTQDKQIKFLKALINGLNKHVILIRDDFKYYSGKQVVDWVFDNKNKIELHPTRQPKTKKYVIYDKRPCLDSNMSND
ncbi:winged helix-turn-helix domain-containing protein [Pelobacter propionicus]|uniref:Putative transposase n=1 Tax=Pelobacter propionicus (strain DSM 2379 / NBRC 103807 / OttBd1) TaxID=338966 RepID=A1AUY4_PELPD|nr:winged helix-turn-helix domain-containing protein [Pelobacter propionicus]ABL01155.1 putative transposase [Pelobacter propionicus DSM 2379]